MSIDSTEEITTKLRATQNRKARADIAGLIRQPGEIDGEPQECATCIYFLARRGWCDLPELDFPVDSDWFCKLWRI
jgi:hypothetical protein